MKIAEKIEYIFRGTSPRVQRPAFGPGWEGTCPPPAGGFGVIRKGEKFALLVECYKNTAPAGAEMVAEGKHGFVAVAPIGSTVEWADRFGRKYIGTADGIRAAVDSAL